ncbi:riboflavin synthase subunit alpha [Paraferrimonas sedimenticola]|uniref:Riboflavin synthase n=1 Tax=Paraferrimonas sedimenticola TaxID=375674 RepID=A0AA37RWZ5_9GAMM|nr:riboflavin synthase subunit alpha [Paraferrimonas sedimenticola]GLP96142.1 riboflavin synthase subunit alpha [Paraferrimonas sedimenticola]
MFTGIVHETARVVSIDAKQEFQTHVIEVSDGFAKGIELGASVAHNGCCLTVTKAQANQLSFDLMAQTLRLTNLGELRVGDKVNVERAARFGDEIGGHSMSGHIYTTTKIHSIEKSDNNCRVWFDVAPDWRRYVFNKGYIGIDGISLTIAEVENTRFAVNLIPETLARTNLNWRQVGERINIEIDPQTQAIVETVERVLAER